MSEFNIEDLDAVIASADNSLVQMLALQLKVRIKKHELMVAANSALAAENVALAAENKKAVDAVTVFSNVTRDITEIICDEIGLDRVAEIVAAYNDLGNMPATDRIVAGIKADGVEEFIGRLQQCVDDGDFVGDEAAVIVGAIDCGKEFCEQQRKGADK